MDVIDEYGLLGPDILVSHASNMTDSDGQKLNKANASISSTPDTELQMGLGYPVCFRDDVKGISSLGTDCHANNGSSIVSQMRLALQAERGRQNQVLIQQKKAPKTHNTSAHEMFRLATIGGARAAKMEGQIGSLEEGKLADIIVFDGLSPGMVCAAEKDPVAAILFHSSIGDIVTVIVDGIIRKNRGKLTAVNLQVLGTNIKPKRPCLEWSDVARELLISRDRIEKEDAKNWTGSVESAVNDLAKIFQIDEGSLA